MIWIVLGITLMAVLFVNIYMYWIVDFFLHTTIDLLSLRIFSLAPIFLAVSSFLASNFFVAFNHNKYMLYSIIITTIAYLIGLGFVMLIDRMNSVYSFVSISLFSYFVEFLFRVFSKARLVCKSTTNN